MSCRTDNARYSDNSPKVNATVERYTNLGSLLVLRFESFAFILLGSSFEALGHINGVAEHTDRNATHLLKAYLSLALQAADMAF
jgi:hypothetical protein